MAVEQMVFVDHRNFGGKMTLQLKSGEPIRHKQFESEFLRIRIYVAQAFLTGVGDYSVIYFLGDDHDVAVSVSREVTSRMALGLVFA